MFEQFIEFIPSAQFIAFGALITLKYSVISVCLGLMIGILLAMCKISNNKLLKVAANFYTSIFRGTPLMIQLSIIYFAIPPLLGIKVDVLTAGIISFSLNSGAYVSEIIRGGIVSVDKGQFEAAQALGIPYLYMMRDIILPQAIRKILPALINELINMLKESAIISILGETDLMRRANMVAAEQLNFFWPMITAAICYYCMVLIFSKLALMLEKKLAL